MSQEIVFNKYQIRSADYHWQQLSNSIFSFNAYVAARYQQVVGQIPKKKNLKILDIGCGDGVLLWLISQKVKSKLFGLDSNRKSLDYAKTKVKAQFFCHKAEQMPFKDNFFDIITAAEIIEHLNQPKLMLQEIKRVLKPKGKLILTTPVKLSSVPGDKMHVREFLPKELKKLLKLYFDKVIVKTSHPLFVKRLYLFNFFKFGKYHFEIFRWIINLWVLLTKTNPFLLPFGQKTNQIAVCRK